ncbi:MAG: DUF488 domain-containing protein [Proteobacteria bacterium]|uniref:DUF488 domain-containing protein n=1 Tax=Rudaea sp. TaxID=2136325 RepID=UPI001D7C2D93|nr:DUF488 domain-containing protein [Pseudomonadota bacterium]MBS0568624.1 DUF488 domain-containing protein [Pseudomonadota bacterium]
MPAHRHAIAIKRAYAAPDEDDGYRILVDRLWPRGLGKDAAHVDLWLKEIAPSPALRVWFGHDPARFAEFRRRYDAELKSNTAAVAQMDRILAQTPVTLVYAAKDETHNHAIVLKNFLESRR